MELQIHFIDGKQNVADEIYFKENSKNIKKYIKENELTDTEISKIRKEKLELFSLFGAESLKNDRNKFEEMLNKIKEYSNVIQLILYDYFMPYFKTFFAFRRWKY